jgi:hypothetical protein
MMRKTMLIVLLSFLGTVCFAGQSPWDTIEKMFNKKGTRQSNMFKITFPRNDLNVSIDNVAISPDLAFTTWLAFRPEGRGAMMMGDIVLQESDITVAEFILDSAKIQITGLHNHLINESPKIMYMHILGHGNPVSMAKVMKSVFASIGMPFGEYATPAKKTFDWSPVNAVLGMKGTVAGDVIKYSIPRPDRITENGMEVSPFMGMATVVNFQSDDTKAIVTGDFVLQANEIAPVMHTLISYSISVTALHNHMLDESPKIYFLHFLGYDDPVHLADGIKAALGEIGKGTKSGKTKFNLK